MIDAKIIVGNPFENPEVVAKYNELNNKMLDIIEQLEKRIKQFELKVAYLESLAAYESKLREFYETELGCTIILLRHNLISKKAQFEEMNNVRHGSA